MFNLLVVDDETLTRTGIIEIYPWEELGIKNIIQADDGNSGLQKASQFKIDIVLTDVRMPCMNGIEMCRGIRKIYPKCKIIFMSGYSDKEYLMSAIDLNAIKYIEKPIRRHEIINVIEEAVIACKEEQQKKIQEATMEKKVNISLPFLKKELAIRFLRPGLDYNLINEYTHLGLLFVNLENMFVTVIVQIVNEYALDDSKIQNKLLYELEQLSRKYNFEEISAFKDNKYLISHFSYGPNWKLNSKIDNIKSIYLELCSNMLSGDYFISIGKQVTGVMDISNSYNSAVIALQKAFFRSFGSVVISNNDESVEYHFNEDKLSEFIILLDNGKKQEAQYMLTRLAADIRKHENTLIKYVKDIFFKFMLEINKYLEKYRVTSCKSKYHMDYLWEAFNNTHTLDELLKLCHERINNYFDIIDTLKNEKTVIIKIMDYIHTNYHYENLSVKDISLNTFLSPAYLCTYFKQETGKTINQYITECRLDRARELLSKKDYMVSEIAQMVGYSDGNYFTKIFKKGFGMTPSEYRVKSK